MSSKVHARNAVGEVGGFQAFYPGVNQKLTTSGSAAISAAFAGTTSLIRVFATTDTYLAFGTSPIATSSDYFLPGGIIDFVGVQPGQKVSGLQSTSAGTLYICEGS